MVNLLAKSGTQFIGMKGLHHNGSTMGYLVVSGRQLGKVSQYGYSEAAKIAAS
jgi:hypothetical protein